MFVSDTTAEGERLGAVLRARGYSVVDVPTDQLAERASGSLPSLVICDVEAPGAKDALLTMLGVPDSSEIALVVVGESDQSIRSAVDLVGMGVADSFARPLDVAAMLRRAEALVGAPSSLPGGSLMPPAARSSRHGPASGTGMPPPSRRMSSRPAPAEAPPPSAARAFERAGASLGSRKGAIVAGTPGQLLPSPGRGLERTTRSTIAPGKRRSSA